MHLPLFTFVADFRGGTYISQHRGHDVRQALERWAMSSDFGAVAGLRSEVVAAAASRLVADPPMEVAGASSVWCATTDIEDALLLVHIVQTVAA